jgi:hypothetical protein
MNNDVTRSQGYPHVSRLEKKGKAFIRRKKNKFLWLVFMERIKQFASKSEQKKGERGR